MTERVGLLGWPVGHSISPAMHNAAFEALGLDWRYDLLPVPPGNLEAAITRLVEQEGYRGFNVTIPHKRAILAHPLIRAISPAVEVIDAANTLVVEPDGTLRADNTDWLAFAADLQRKGIQVYEKVCLILGTGGSAGAVELALFDYLGSNPLTWVSRNPGRRSGVIGYDEIPFWIPRVDLIVNCTPVGMFPNGDQSPWPEDMPFPPQAVLYDLVYNPPVTRLMQQAQAAGAQAFGGLGMLVRQGARSFEVWTGVRPPLDVMFEAATAALKAAHTE
jgi:shikimate dehydrogenase